MPCLISSKGSGLRLLYRRHQSRSAEASLSVVLGGNREKAHSTIAVRPSGKGIYRRADRQSSCSTINSSKLFAGPDQAQTETASSPTGPLWPGGCMYTSPSEDQEPKGRGGSCEIVPDLAANLSSSARASSAGSASSKLSTVAVGRRSRHWETTCVRSARICS